MLEQAINRILTLATPNVVEINGRPYADKHLERIPRELRASALEVHTLSAIIDYITSGTDDCALLPAEAQDGDITARDRRYVIHIEEFNRVTLALELGADKQRECLLEAKCDLAGFPFGRFMDVEAFIINLQSSFVPGVMVDKLAQLVGTITDGNSITLSDDGVTQRATAKTGIQLVSSVSVPNPVMLAPYRTFSEIEQPESPFVFRVRGGDGGVSAALFAADGDAWKRDAILTIRDWFMAEIPDQLRDDVIILA